MSDDLQVQAELRLKDSLSAPASKALRGVSSEARRVSADAGKNAAALKGTAAALARVGQEGKQASRSLEGIPLAVARIGHSPFAAATRGLQQMERNARRTTQEVSRMSRVMRGMGGAVGQAGGVLRGQAAAIAGGVVAAGSAMQVVDMDARNTALKANANMTPKEFAAFKRARQQAASTSLVAESDVQAIAEVVQDITGDRAFYTKSLAVMAKAQKASGSDARSVGTMSAVLHDIGITDPKELERAYSGLALQGDRGAYTLGDITKYGGGVLSMYSALGHGGKQGAFEANTALQLAMSTTKNAATATTAVDAFLRDLQNKEIQKKLKKAKINVFDKQGNFRSLTDIQKDILSRTGGDLRKFNRLGFTDEAKRAMTFAMGQYKQSRNFDFMDKYGVTGDEGTLDRKWRENSESINSGLTAVGNSWSRLMDSMLTEPLRTASKYIVEMGEDTRNTAVALGALAAVALALFAKFKAAQALFKLGGKLLGKGGGTALEGAAKGAAGGAQGASAALATVQAQKKTMVNALKADIAKGGMLPVKGVVTAEGGIASGLPAAVPQAAKAAAKNGFVPDVKALLKGGVLSTVLAGAEVAATELDDSLTRAQKNEAHTETAGGLAGSLALAKVGAVSGAALGSLLGPIGTAIGGAIGGIGGGIAGYLGGSWAGKKLGGWLFGDKDEAPQSENSAQNPPDIARTVLQAAQIMQNQPLAATLNIQLEMDGEVIARKVEQVQLRQSTRR